MSAGDGEPAGSPARLWFALILALGLGTIAVVLVLTSGDDSAAPAQAPAECLRAWNADVVAREEGRHSRTFHQYEEAQVGYLSGEAEIATDAAAGPCAVVFPRTELDPEPEYAGFALTGRRWPSLDQSLPPEDLARLQSLAVPATNATLGSDGRLTSR